jgi:hypothetical protein
MEGSHTPPLRTLTAAAGAGKSSSMVKQMTFDAPATCTLSRG